MTSSPTQEREPIPRTVRSRPARSLGGANAATYTLPSAQLSDSGAKFRCIVTNAVSSATSNEATLTVVTNTAPTATITGPADGSFYRAGDTISYSGTGTDTQDGTEPASQFTWQIDFHHNDTPAHIHPALPPTTGATSGTYVIPNNGETSANVFYRIILTVTDSGGLSTTTYHDIYPLTATITLAGSPGGLTVTLDGQPHAAPYSVLSVVGMLRVIGAASPQTIAGVTYYFSTWSDKGKQSHTITTPATNTTYTVTFKVRGKR